MKLDPVFVIAPKPNPPTMPTRRAFLIAGTTFTLGTAVGGACGYSIAAAAGSGPNAAPEVEVPPSGDVELDELRRLAIKAPIEELVGRRVDFTLGVANAYRKDEVLWKGIERLATAVLSDEAMRDRRTTSRLLAQIIELADAPYRDRHLQLAKKLRAIK